MNICFAPGVVFDEEKHEYHYKGSKLSGVTGVISKHLGKKYASEFVEEHREEGLHIHRAIQHWIENGNPESIHEGVQWIIRNMEDSRLHLASEVLVSDFRHYASSVDIVVVPSDGNDGVVGIFDIKKGKLDRPSVTWQLSIYKYFIEKYSPYTVKACTCISLKDREFWDIFPKKAEEVEKLLYSVL